MDNNWIGIYFCFNFVLIDRLAARPIQLKRHCRDVIPWVFVLCCFLFCVMLISTKFIALRLFPPALTNK